MLYIENDKGTGNLRIWPSLEAWKSLKKYCLSKMLLRSWLLPVKKSSYIFFYVIDGSVNIKCDVMLDTLGPVRSSVKLYKLCCAAIVHWK